MGVLVENLKFGVSVLGLRIQDLGFRVHISGL
jgi:hypothetical protein